SALVAACAMPGTADLMAKGTTSEISVRGTPAALASCLTTKLDEEPWEIGVLPSPVARSRVIEETGSIELQGGYEGSGSPLIWLALFRPAEGDRTSVELTTRDTISLSLS